MKKNILYHILILLLVMTSCEEDTNYELKETKPRGGFVERDLAVEAGYFESGSAVVDGLFEMQQMETDQDVNLSVVIKEVVPEEVAPAISLLTNTVAVKGRDSLAVELIKVDWSRVDPGTTATVVLEIEESADIEVNTVMSNARLSIKKEEVPIAWLDKSATYKAIMDYGAMENKTFTYTFNLLTIPAEQDIDIPVRTNEYYASEGVHFNMPDKVLHIAKGSTSATLEIEALADGFVTGEVQTLWIEIHQEDIADDLLVQVDGDWWWTAIDLGIDWKNFIKLDSSISHDLLVDSNLEGEITYSLSIGNVLSKPASETMTIPVLISEGTAAAGTHFRLEEPFITVKAGETSGTLKLVILTDGFSDGNKTAGCWLEIDGNNLPADFSVDNEDWWTTLNLGIK